MADDAPAAPARAPQADPATLPDVVRELYARFGENTFVCQQTRDDFPNLWVPLERRDEVLRFLKNEVPRPFKVLLDLQAIDERLRRHREGQPAADFTLFYHLLSLERCHPGDSGQIRLKVALQGEHPTVPTITRIYANANWYERETWDLFGIRFEGHPNLQRILLPRYWKGHPGRKDYPARATEFDPYVLTQARQDEEQAALLFRPEEWGMQRGTEEHDFMFLNLGPNHPSAHGAFRVILQLDGEQIVDAVPDIGYHHRGAEKMAERQSWHTYIPYTDRVDYLSGILNELPYVLAVEKLAGIEVPPRVQVIRIMLAELFRIISHLVFLGTFAQDLGAMSPVFYMFTDREKAFTIIEAITGARMHPGWLRIGGLSADLPKGWEALVNEFLEYMPPRMDEYDKVLFANSIFRGRTVGIGRITKDEAMEWGVTGPFLRSTGFAWDWRKARPYAGYDQFEFDIPVGANGDCYDRAIVHAQEIRQSLRIIRQCVDNMPSGPWKSNHPLATPPMKPRTMQDIETLIDHFLGVSWGPVIPAGEAFISIESSKGNYGYYAISDFDTIPYRMHIRTASFPHLQTIPLLSRGMMMPDMLAILGSIDFVLADVDR
jgi:NADH-quinone oxidoreductase subunit C/D